jgi:O-antigen ligase
VNEAGRRTSGAERPVPGLLALLLLFAPLFRAGNRPLPLLVIELLSLGLLLVLWWPSPRPQRIPAAALVVAVGWLTLPLLYLLPLPEALWQVLPGRGPYAEALAEVAGEPGWGALSLIPSSTEAALYATLPALAVFVGTWGLSTDQARSLVYLLIGVAVFQSMLALMQFGSAPGSPLHLGNPYASQQLASGTYANRDHLAGFLAMVFPLSLALFASTLGRHAGRGRRRGRWRRRLEFVTSIRGHQAAMYALLTVLLLLALVLTRSRAGVGLTMVGLFLAMLAFSRRLGGSNVYGTLGSIAAVVLILVAEIGLAPILDRFSQDPLQDARWTLYATSLDGIGHFFPLGSGAGTFPRVYPAFQVAETGPYLINHAHNDYLETLFEQGMFGLVMILLGLWLYLRQWPRLWISGRWGGFRFIQVGAGIGLALTLAHSLVDFSLHIPANLIVFSFLAAVFLRENREERERKRARPRPSRQGTAEPPSEGRTAKGTAPDGEWERQENPFL